MKIELLVQNIDSGEILDISDLTKSINWSTYLTDQPGKLTFEYVDPDDRVKATEGSIISFKVDDKGVFFGYIFKVGINQRDSVSITAYDQMRYLKNKDTYVIIGNTSSQLFERICKDYKLRYLVKDNSGYTLPSSIEDSSALYDILQKGLDRTLVNTGNWFTIRDNFGTLEFQSLNRLKTNIFIGDASRLSSYEFESSIDTDTYNQVKLVKENKTTSKRELYIVKDSSNIAKWGILQYFENMDESANAAQIKTRAETILNLKNRKTKTLKLSEVTGSLEVFAGSGIILGINKLVSRGIPINKYFIVISANHTFTNDKHKMDLELQVSI